MIVAGRDAGRGAEVVDAIRADAARPTSCRPGCTTRRRRGTWPARPPRPRRPHRHPGEQRRRGAFGATAGFDEEVFDATFGINVKAPFYLVSEIAPAMAGRGQGVIVNVVTMAAQFGIPGMAVYGGSKAALTLMTKSWAAEFGPSGVRVNAVSPGPTRTPGTQAMGDALDQLAAQYPAGHPAGPEDIAAVIAFLAGDEARYVQGAVVNVDGGRTAV